MKLRCIKDLYKSDLERRRLNKKEENSLMIEEGDYDFIIDQTMSLGWGNILMVRWYNGKNWDHWSFDELEPYLVPCSNSKENK